jgi:hypothetical protein
MLAQILALLQSIYLVSDSNSALLKLRFRQVATESQLLSLPHLIMTENNTVNQLFTLVHVISTSSDNLPGLLTATHELDFKILKNGLQSLNEKTESNFFIRKGTASQEFLDWFFIER